MTLVQKVPSSSDADVPDIYCSNHDSSVDARPARARVFHTVQLLSSYGTLHCFSKFDPGSVWYVVHALRLPSWSLLLPAPCEARVHNMQVTGFVVNPAKPGKKFVKGELVDI